MTPLHEKLSKIDYNYLPPLWQGFDFARFSNSKSLFRFQEEALENVVKVLKKFYEDAGGDKEEYFRTMLAETAGELFDLNIKRRQDSKSLYYLSRYPDDYPKVRDRISFACFANRVSFWMATGSGKTLVIVKLIDLLRELFKRDVVPQKDILFLAHRGDLIEQFQGHIYEFNRDNPFLQIRLINLKDYSKSKANNRLAMSEDEITIYYYRSDLLSDEQKETIVDYQNYENNGNWYILLDEAHKGDREESKRQTIYSIMSRNGFLFNFSATFDDNRDRKLTCAYNFNLDRFVNSGYGKKTYVVQSNLSAFRRKDDFSPIEKKKIVIKAMILHSYIHKHFEQIRCLHNSAYHRPLLLTLVNTVEKGILDKDPDLELFFKEVVNIASGNIDDKTFIEARCELETELKQSIQSENISQTKYSIGEIDKKDILRYVFNTETAGVIEVLKIPGNKQELIFKLKTSDAPFALIKIGDISGWLKKQLSQYEIIERYENESVFNQINRDDSQISMLLGSRAFYEGWDSNRPNIIMFINIGTQLAKKFVLQSIGRGVRIEPIKNQRMRLESLHLNDKSFKELHSRLGQFVDPLETLYVFGTKSENLQQILNTMSEERREARLLGDLFVKSQSAQGKLLLIPVYKEMKDKLVDVKEPLRYDISQSDYDLVRSMFWYLGKNLILLKYDCDIDVLYQLENVFDEKHKTLYFRMRNDLNINNVDVLLRRILRHFSTKRKELDKFKELEDEIIHFKRIMYLSSNGYEDIREKIKKMQRKPQLIAEYREHVKQGIISFDEYDEKQKSLLEAEGFTYNNESLKIKHIKNHYYVPIAISNQDERVSFINHIIQEESEVSFVNQLDEFVEKNKEYVKSVVDWWNFSKIDESIDDIYIPYFNESGGKMRDFYPDFIFWLVNGNDYTILFVDPKGTEHSVGLHKIDGFRKLFIDDSSGQYRSYLYQGYQIKVKLLLFCKDLSSVPELYRSFWFDDVSKLFESL